MEEQKMTSGLSIWSNQVTDLVQRDFKANGIEMSEYEKTCGLNAISSIYQLVKSSGVAMNEIDTSNLRETVGQCASLQLNANGYPRECYFQLRKKKIGNNYVQTIEMGIEGAGAESILRNFGLNVDVTYDWWLVKDGDDFTYPKRKGIVMTDPEWEQKGLSQKTIRVVLPIKLKDGSVTYLISERESVKVNLFAHVRNNLMNETFGICKSRYDATDAQKKQIEDKKEVIYDALRKCETVDDMLACEIAKPYMSGAWLDTPESMIVRKMQNNAVKKYPKVFNNMAKESLLQMDETYQQTKEEIANNANSVPFELEENVIDVECKEVQ